MKIIKFDEFVLMPEGTIFSYYPFNGGLWRKGKTIHDAHPNQPQEPCDYFQQSLSAQYFNSEYLIGVKERWGEHDYDQSYVVYDSENVNKMIELLKT